MKRIKNTNMKNTHKKVEGGSTGSLEDARDNLSAAVSSLLMYPGDETDYFGKWVIRVLNNLQAAEKELSTIIFQVGQED